MLVFICREALSLDSEQIDLEFRENVSFLLLLLLKMFFEAFAAMIECLSWSVVETIWQSKFSM